MELMVYRFRAYVDNNNDMIFISTISKNESDAFNSVHKKLSDEYLTEEDFFIKFIEALPIEEGIII